MVPAQSGYRVLSTKIEIKLRKAEGIRYVCLVINADPVLSRRICIPTVHDVRYFVSHFRICLKYCRVLQLDLDASHRMFEFTKLIFYALGTAGTCITHPVLSMIGNYCKYFVNVPTNSLKMLTSSLTSQVFFAVLFCIIYHFFIFQMKQK